MIGLQTHPLERVAVIGAHCHDIAIAAGATLLQIAQQHPDAVVHGLVLSGGGTVREIEERTPSRCAPRLRSGSGVADLPAGRFSDHRDRVKQQLAEFRGGCDPDVVFAPRRHDYLHDHRVVAELVPTEFRDHLVLGYEILKCESDLPNPTLFLPIPAESARRKTALDARARRPVPFPLRGGLRRGQGPRGRRRHCFAELARLGQRVEGAEPLEDAE
jgi:LmbE family N-acetylglucosaminyl deacetylase